MKTILNVICVFVLNLILSSFVFAQSQPIPDKAVLSRTSQSVVYDLIDYRTNKSALAILQQITTVYVDQTPGKNMGSKRIDIAIQLSFHGEGEGISHYFHKSFPFESAKDKEFLLQQFKISILQDDPSHGLIRLNRDGDASLQVFTKISPVDKKEVKYYIQSTSRNLSGFQKSKYKIEIFKPARYEIKNKNGYDESLFTMGWRQVTSVTPIFKNGVMVQTQMGNIHYIFSGHNFTEVRNLKPTNIEKKTYFLTRPGIGYRDGAAIEFDLSEGKLRPVAVSIGENTQTKLLEKAIRAIQACEKIY